MVWPITYPEDYKPVGSWYEENFKMDFDDFDGRAPGEEKFVDRLKSDPSELKPSDMPDSIADEAKTEAQNWRARGGRDIEPFQADGSNSDRLYKEIKEIEAREEEIYGPAHRDDCDNDKESD